jgi:FtsP/CotA-like multicopper oxidase with cupredoxin domain
VLGDGLLTRREVLRLSGMAAASAAMPLAARELDAADYRIEIAPFSLEVARNKFVRTIAYNGQVPGPLLRMKEGRRVTVEVVNHSANEEVVHWHGQYLPPEVDGAMEEGTPMIAPGQSVRFGFIPGPTGFRWYHTHTFAGKNLKKAAYTGQHGLVMVEPKESAGAYDQEFFLGLHDWNGFLQGSDDGSMNPIYDVSTINGRRLGFGESLRVKAGQRVMLHVLNSSATEPHWLALSGHKFRVVALDGNAVARPQLVTMVRLSPGERVSAVVEMSNPGVWVLGEVQREVQAAGMGVVVEYEGKTGAPQWVQPKRLVWDYGVFAAETAVRGEGEVVEIPLVFESKFAGHGAMDKWLINGKSYPDTSEIALREGQRYRLVFKNKSTDDHPVHLHRHSFELRRVPGHPELQGVLKDVVLVGAGTQLEVEFTADHPGKTLFHCHQQDHMDMGFMMLFRYA